VMDDLLSAEQILELRSKDKDQKMRLNFRAGIERFINKELAFITDPRERRAQINGFIIRKREEIREIEKELEEFSKKWPTRIGFASLGFVTAGIAAFDLLHGGVFSTASEAALGIGGFGGSVIYAARGAVKDLREGAPELEKEMAFAAWVGPASRRRSLWHRIARRLHLH